MATEIKDDDSLFNWDSGVQKLRTFINNPLDTAFRFHTSRIYNVR